MIDFEAISSFVVDRIDSMQKTAAMPEQRTSNKSERSKAYYTFETRKLAVTYMESHRQYLT
jgi:hypothetical protein